MLMHALASLSLALPALPQERPNADQLIEQAWEFLPAYDGNQRALLTRDVERETQAGAHLLQAGLALNPDHLRGLWSLGHAHSLLAENHRNRGRMQRAEEERQAAKGALERALELDPADPWSAYALAMAQTRGAEHGLALLHLKRALANTERAIDAGQNQDTMRFKSLEWMPELEMRAGQGARARASLRLFHGEFSSNSWPLLIALGESFLRERDFGAARSIYRQTMQAYPNDFQAYALMGYLEGLSGNPESAAEHMRLAIRSERFAGMYTRLWFWILATPELEAAARQDLAAFLKNPPDSVSEWDRTLGLFATGEVALLDFERALEAETTRRLEAAEALDHLACEAAYYRGQRHERQAAEAKDADTRKSQRMAALCAYREALEARPIQWKWEWAYARLGLARVAQELGLSALSTPASAAGGALRWHRPGMDQAQGGVPEVELPGDLIFLPIADEARAGLELFVIDAR